MATPSSSGTSPSPALSFALPATVSEISTDDPNDHELAEREERRKKILARTEFAKITRALRSRLSLASYKAKHNVVDVPLHSLEAQVAQQGRAAAQQQGQSSPSAFSAPFGGDKKRKANHSMNNAGYYGSPLAQGNVSSSNLGMPSPHASYARPSGPGPANATKSLFASILALPPAKRARTIHNPEAPPVPPPLPPSHAKSKRAAKKSTKKGKESTVRGRGKVAAKEGKGKDRARKNAAGRGRANSISSIRTRSSFSGETENVNDTDIKAAETLTDLLFSRAGGTASPRSSLSAPTRMMPSGPGVGHAPPLSQTSSMSSLSAAPRPNAHVRTGSNASTASTGTCSYEREDLVQHTDIGMDVRRSLTPTVAPRLAARPLAATSTNAQASGVFGATLAPVQRAADSEAADLMLLLANSPSPARLSGPRDQDISRNVYAAGRVLFPSGGSSGGAHWPESTSAGGRGLARGIDGGSFSSVFTSESGEGSRESEIRRAGSASTSPPLSQLTMASSPRTSETIVTPPTPDPSVLKTPSSGVRPLAASLSPGLLPSPPSPTRSGPQTPSGAFNMNDYINITPTPVQTLHVASHSALSHPPSSSTYPASQSSTMAAPSTSSRFRSAVSVSSPLRKSFDRESMGIGIGGRKLFENEPGGGNSNGGGSGDGAGRKMRFGEGVEGPGSLGSGIDLVQT